MGLLQKIEQRYKIKGWWQFSIIIIVFAVTGSSSVWVGKRLLSFLGVGQDMNPWVWYPARIVTITVCYQILLLFFGTIFGQFVFFWEFEKKMLSRFGLRNKGEKQSGEK